MNALYPSRLEKFWAKVNIPIRVAVLKDKALGAAFKKDPRSVRESFRMVRELLKREYVKDAVKLNPQLKTVLLKLRKELPVRKFDGKTMLYYTNSLVGSIPELPRTHYEALKEIAKKITEYHLLVRDVEERHVPFAEFMKSWLKTERPKGPTKTDFATVYRATLCIGGGGVKKDFPEQTFNDLANKIKGLAAEAREHAKDSLFAPPSKTGMKQRAIEDLFINAFTSIHGTAMRFSEESRDAHDEVTGNPVFEHRWTKYFKKKLKKLPSVAASIKS